MKTKRYVIFFCATQWDTWKTSPRANRTRGDREPLPTHKRRKSKKTQNARKNCPSCNTWFQPTTDINRRRGKRKTCKITWKLERPDLLKCKKRHVRNPSTRRNRYANTWNNIITHDKLIEENDIPENSATPWKTHAWKRHHKKPEEKKQVKWGKKEREREKKKSKNKSALFSQNNKTHPFESRKTSKGCSSN